MALWKINVLEQGHNLWIIFAFNPNDQGDVHIHDISDDYLSILGTYVYLDIAKKRCQKEFLTWFNLKNILFFSANIFK